MPGRQAAWAQQKQRLRAHSHAAPRRALQGLQARPASADGHLPTCAPGNCLSPCRTSPAPLSSSASPPRKSRKSSAQAGLSSRFPAGAGSTGAWTGCAVQAAASRPCRPRLQPQGRRSAIPCVGRQPTRQLAGPTIVAHPLPRLTQRHEHVVALKVAPTQHAAALLHLQARQRRQQQVLPVRGAHRGQAEQSLRPAAPKPLCLGPIAATDSSLPQALACTKPGGPPLWETSQPYASAATG